MLGDEYPAFEESYDRPRRGGLRINALKKGLQEPEKVLLSGTGAEQAPMYLDLMQYPGYIGMDVGIHHPVG